MEIKGYENYLIYEDGLIYNQKTDKFLKGGIKTNAHGYKSIRVVLRKNKKKKDFTVARLLMEHFRPEEWDKDLTVDHINQDSLDNRLCNLRMADRFLQQENTREIRSTNTSGYKNICYDKNNKVWKYEKIKNKKKIQKNFRSKVLAIAFKLEYEKII